MKYILNTACVALSFAPLLLSAIAIALFLPDAIPMHIDANGNINWYGGKAEELLLAGLMTVVNLACALCGIFAEKLWALGLISGVKTPGAARVFLLGTILFIDLVFAAIVVWQCTA